jgi:Ras-related protein Rab-4B
MEFFFCEIFFFLLIQSRESYNAVTNWLADARALASPNIVIVLCGNKKDLEDQRQVTFLEADRFAQENSKIQFGVLFK